MTITSPHNEKLKEIRRLTRARNRAASGRFVAEGEDLLGAADAAGWVAAERFCAAGSGLAGVEVEPAILADVSALGSGTRTLAVYEERWAPAAAGPLCVYLHGVSDPGNVGAVLRSAEAFGASCVAIGPATADPYGPKAVRASMGAVFGVPVARVAAPSKDTLPGSLIALVAGQGVPLSELSRFGTTPRYQNETVRRSAAGAAAAGAAGGVGEVAAAGGVGEVAAAGAAGGVAGQATPAARAPTTLLIGSERHGLPDELVAAADHVTHIPILTHSLNAAMAATVALYELTHRMAPR